MDPAVTTTAASGPPRPQSLLFVHGAWHGGWCWEDHFIPWFTARGYECHALDLRGHGSSGNDRPLWRTRIKHYVRDLETVVEGLDRPPVIIGHSMGGLVTQRFAEGREEIPGVALLAPVPLGGVWRATIKVLRRHPLRFLRANLTWRLWPIVATPTLGREMFLAEDAAADATDRLHDRLQDESYLAYLDMLLFVRSRPPLVPAPALVVAGSADTLFSVEEMQRAAAAYGAEAVVVDGAAHDLMLDERWEQSAQAVVDWIDGLGGPESPMPRPEAG